MKCGAEVAAAMGIGSAVAGIFGSGISAMSAESINQDQLGFTASENQKNRDWQSQEVEKARQWNANEWDRQFEAQNEQYFRQLHAQQSYWKQQQNFINNYNSPEAQRQRYLDAGLNPAGIVGEAGNAGGMAPALSTNVSAPASMASPVPSPVGNASVNLRNPFEGFGQTLAGTFNSFAQGFKSLLTAGPEGQKAAAEAKEALQKTEYFASMKQSTDLANEIVKSTKDERIQQVIYSTQKLKNDIWLQGLRGTLYDAEIDKTLSETLVNHAEEALKYAQTDKQRQEIMTYFDMVHGQLQYWRDLGSSAKTNAAANMITANSIKAVNDSVVILNQDKHVENLYDQLVKGIADNNPNYKGSWITQKEGGNSLSLARRAYASSLEKEISLNNDLTPEQIQQAKYATEQLKVAANYAELNAALGALGNAVGMANASKMANAARLNAEAHSSSAGSYGRFVDGQLRRMNTIRERYVEHYDGKGNLTGTILESTN